MTYLKTSLNLKHFFNQQSIKNMIVSSIHQIEIIIKKLKNFAIFFTIVLYQVFCSKKHLHFVKHPQVNIIRNIVDLHNQFRALEIDELLFCILIHEIIIISGLCFKERNFIFVSLHYKVHLLSEPRRDVVSSFYSR